MAWVTKVNTLRFGSSTPSAFYYGSTAVNTIYQGTTIVYQRVNEYVLLPFSSGSSEEEYINGMLNNQINYQQNGYANAELYSGEITIQTQVNSTGLLGEVYSTPTWPNRTLNFTNYSQMSVKFTYREQQNYSSGRTHYLSFIFYTSLDSLHTSPLIQFKQTAFNDSWTTKVLNCSSLKGGSYYFAIKQYLKCTDGQYSGTQSFIGRIALS